MGSNDQQQLIYDQGFHYAIQTAQELSTQIIYWIPRRDATLDNLRLIQKLIEESYQKRTIAKVSGASAAAVGSTMAIVGFGLSFVTFGASLGLTIVGGVIAAAGGITMGGSDIGDLVVSRSHMKSVESIIEKDRQLSTEIRETAERLSTQVKKLATKYPTMNEQVIFTAIANIITGGQAAKVLYDGYKIIDAGFDVGRAILRVGRFASTGASAARIAWTGINTIAGGLSIAGVVFDAIALPFDFFVLVKGSYDIHKYRTGNGSNSNKANKVAKIINDLEQHKQEMLQIQSVLQEES